MNRKLHIPTLPLAILAGALAARPALGQEAQPAPEPAAAPEPAEDEPAGKLPPSVKVDARIHAGYALERQATSADDSARETENKFLVDVVRLKGQWRPTDWFLAAVQIDLADTVQLGSSLLKDAYVHLSPLDQLQIRVGQFKKPFSGLALESPAKLKVIDRGPGVKYIAEDLLYGDRDLGLQLSGRLIKAVKLDYQIGVFNGSGPQIGEPGNSKDLVGRVSIRPIKQIELAANAVAKFLDDPRPKQPGWAIAAGGDARLQIKGFRLYAEALVAPDHAAYLYYTRAAPDHTPNALAVLALAAYRRKFDTAVRFAVEPVFKAELYDPNSYLVDDAVWVFTPGINFYVGEFFRIMLDGEFVRAGAASQDSMGPNLDSESLQVLLCFDT